MCYAEINIKLWEGLMIDPTGDYQKVMSRLRQQLDQAEQNQKIMLDLSCEEAVVLLNLLQEVERFRGEILDLQRILKYTNNGE